MFSHFHFLSTEMMLVLATGSSCVSGWFSEPYYCLLVVRIVVTLFIFVP